MPANPQRLEQAFRTCLERHTLCTAKLRHPGSQQARLLNALEQVAGRCLWLMDAAELIAAKPDAASRRSALRSIHALAKAQRVTITRHADPGERRRLVKLNLNAA